MKTIYEIESVYLDDLCRYASLASGELLILSQDRELSDNLMDAVMDAIEHSHRRTDD